MTVAERRQRERQERRDQIVQAATKVFRSKGFQAATMDEIAAEAEVSKGTLYLHFKNKDDLFVAISTTKIGEVFRRFSAIATAELSGLEQLREMLSAYADVALSDPEMFRNAVMWLSAGERVDVESPAFCDHRCKVEGAMGCLVATLQRGQADGSVRGDIDARSLASQLWGGMLGTLLVRINAEELSRRVQIPEFERNVPGFIRLICDGLRPQTGAEP